eukprot:3411863-Ditylum_brightwellii.AAC.1
MDKNLGPAIIEQEEYTYKQLTNGEAKASFYKTRNTVIRLFMREHKGNLNEWKITFFERLLDIQRLRKPAFYILAKVHKLPWKTRPVDSLDLRKKLESISSLERDTAIFTFDATAMYINIDVDHYLIAKEAWLNAHANKLPDKFPMERILKALQLVMKSN